MAGDMTTTMAGDTITTMEVVLILEEASMAMTEVVATSKSSFNFLRVLTVSSSALLSENQFFTS